MKFHVRPYTTLDGAQPMMRFLADLKLAQPVLAKLLEAGIRKLEDSSNHGAPLTKQVDREHRILEVRVGSSDIARVLLLSSWRRDHLNQRICEEESKARSR